MIITVAWLHAAGMCKKSSHQTDKRKGLCFSCCCKRPLETVVTGIKEGEGISEDVH